MADIQQALQLATTNAQLAILPTFANNPIEDRTSSTEWLQKLLNNKQGGNWTDVQTITHFRNALRGKALKWYNGLPLMKIDNLNWDLVKAHFEEDFQGTPNSSSVIQKLPEIRQKDDERVIDYVSRVTEILLDLKAKTDISELNMQLQLSDAATAVYTGLNEAEKHEITKEIKK